ncbi:hypothetical protein EMF65_22370 [Klebsiella pneumoniae]|nr:hypothetical protein EMF65_22370 [Klebsiella pneumoniae]
MTFVCEIRLRKREKEREKERKREKKREKERKKKSAGQARNVAEGDCWGGAGTLYTPLCMMV